MNIYDIAGNVMELTLEWTSDTRGPCAYRGGNFITIGSYYPAAKRSYESTDFGNFPIGFRVSLF